MKDIKVTRFRQGANALLAHFSDPSDGFLLECSALRTLPPWWRAM